MEEKQTQGTETPKEKPAKKQPNKAVLFLIAIILMAILIAIYVSAPEEEQTNPMLNAIVDNIPDSATNDKKELNIGDKIDYRTFSLTYLDGGLYECDNMFMQPSEGNVYYFIELEAENTGKNEVIISSSSDWTGYADGYVANQRYLDPNVIFKGRLSSGKKLKGKIFLEVPENSENVVIEYKENIFLNDVTTFIIK